MTEKKLTREEWVLACVLLDVEKLKDAGLMDGGPDINVLEMDRIRQEGNALGFHDVTPDEARAAFIALQVKGSE